MKAFEFINEPLQGRITEKPREKGLTMVIDTGLGLNSVRDLMENASEYIDLVKLAFGTSRLMDREALIKKIELYKEYGVDVFPGGTFLEIAYSQNALEKFLEEARKLGFTAIEVSDGSIKVSEAERERIISMVKEKGFEVLAEVGKKLKSEDLTPEEYAEAIERDLELGVFKVLIEAREAGRGIGIYDDSGKVIEERVDLMLKHVDVHELMFEAPLKSQQLWLISKYGPNVNLGNIHPEDVIALEALRRGLRADTFILSMRKGK